MKRISLVVIILTLSIFANAQISGVKNIPGDYASLAAAITALNTSGVGAGGVTINLNQVETAPTGGYLLGSVTLNATTGSTKPIVINGGNNTITAQATGTTTTSDAVFRLAGPDYVTLNQLKIVENAANTTVATQMERGIAVMAFSATDGSQNVTIQGCTITLGGTTQINSNETGILLTNILYNNTTSAYTTAVVPTSTAGKFDSIVVKSNTITNCYTGIAAHGGTVATTAANLLQTRVVIGGTSIADANTISGYGGQAVAATTIGYGIYVSSVANEYVSYNNLSATSVFSPVNHVHVTACAGNIVTSNNTISFATGAASTGAQNGVNVTGFSATLTNTSRCDSNTVQNVTLGGTSVFIGINHNILGLTGTVFYNNNNKIENITRTGTGGNITGVLLSSTSPTSVPNDKQQVNNTVKNITVSAGTAAFLFNGIQWLGTSGLMKGNTVDNINITNSATAVSNITLINSSCNVNTGLVVPHSVDSNIVKTVSLTGPSFAGFGITLINGAAVNNTYSRNIITSISIIGGGTVGRLEGIFDSVNTGTALLNINNNIISNFSSSAANADNAIKGINVISGDATKNLIYNNTIYLGGGSTITSTGTNFGVSGVCFSVGATIKNNIINIAATPNGTGRVAAIRSLLAGTAGVISANFGPNSSNNILYAINATNSFLYAESAVGVAPVVFYNLTNDPNFNTSCSNFKAVAGPKGANTYTGNNLFLVSTGIYAPSGTSLAESNAVPLASVTTDIFGTTRPATPDCGAVEFAGTVSDFSGPTITYTKLENSTFCTTLPALSATITDASGVNVAAGTKPRIYFKKSTDNNDFTGNTSANNGWKFVEATNASSPFQFQINSSLLMTPIAVNDTIQYFIVAQDLVTIPNIGTNQGSYAFGYCPASVDLLAGAFPMQASPAINNFIILSPNITLSATATPSIICINTPSTLTVVDTLTKMGAFPTGYTGPFVTGVDDHEIRRVQIVGTTLNNSSTCATTGGAAANGLPASTLNRYSNYSSTIPAITLTNGTTYTGNIDASVCAATGSGFTMGLSVFIDLNRNGIFDMPQERVYGNPTLDAVVLSPAVSTKNFSFTIPSTGVVNGPTLMRVYLNGYVAGTSHTPSTTTNFGEAEDYQVYLNTSMAPTINSLPNTVFSWSPALNVAPNPERTVIASNISTNTVYTVTATDAGGCTYTKTTSVDIAPGVLATGASGTDSICASTGTTTLTATTTSGVAPFTATWSGGPIVSTAGMSATLNPPVGTTTYAITVSDVCGFTSSTTVDVTVLPNPTAIVSPGTTNVCIGSTLTQTAAGSSPTSVYTWMPGSLVGATQSLSVNSNTTFTITATDGICSSTATFTHSVKSLPTIVSNTVVPSGLVCAGDSVQLTATAVSGVNEYALNSIPYAPITPTGNPTIICDAGVAAVTQAVVGLDNGTWTNLPIGFNFDYYGNNYSTFHLSTNGFITFGSPLNIAGCCSGQVIPSNIAPNNLIALAWEDLDLTASGKIDYFVEGVSPNRKLIVRYINVPRVGGASGNVTGQIILHETTNAIELQIQSVVTGGGDLTTMGIENITGTTATVVSGRNGTDSWSATNEGWIFTKSPVTSYTWSSNQYINNVNINNPKVAPNYTTSYTVTASNVYGCTRTSIATVNVRDLVIGTLNPIVDTICFGNSTTINGNVAIVCPGSSNNFQGYYDPSNWTLTSSNANPNGFVSTGNVPASIVIVSGTNQNANFDDGYTNYSKTIGCDGVVSFNWSYFTNDYAQNDVPYYSINGNTPVMFPTFNVGAITTPNTQTGVMSIPVSAGDVLTLSMYTIDNDVTPGNLTISNFVAPAAPIFGSVSFWNAVTGGTNLGSTSITVSPTNTTTYYAQYTDLAYGCVNPFRDSAKVVVNQLPIITTNALPNDSVCTGDPVTLTASGALSYTWNGNATLTSDTTLAPAIAGVYQVVGTDTNGCSNAALQTIYLNPLPNVTASVNSPICLGNSALFQGGGAGANAIYNWTGGVIDNQLYFPTVAGNATYTVVGTDANGCSETSSVNLLVNTLPVITASASATPICFGLSTVLTGNGAGASGTYTWTDGTNTPTDNVAYTPTISGNTSYTVTGTDANTCSATSSVSVLVYAQTAFNNSIYLSSKCPGVIGGSVIVNSNSGNPYSITPVGPAQPTNGIFNNLIGGTTYTVSSVDANSCSISTTVSATNPANGGLSNATPLNISSVPGNFCQNQNQIDGTTLSYYGATCDNLIATVNDGNGGNTLGNVNACVTVLPTVPTYNLQPYLPRYYIITPQNQGPADITLYFTQDDFDDYNAAAGSFPQIPAVQSVGTATFCISQVPQGFLPGASGASTIVHTVTATWNATANRWEVTFPVTSFSGFYCHACNPLNNSALPAAIADFKGRKTETTDLLTWSTTSELNNDHFNVLYSNNGKDYSQLGSIQSKANSGNSNQVLTYRFENTKPTLGHNYYKLEQVDLDGKSIVNTNVVDLIWGSNGSTISIYPNPTTDELNIDIYTTKAQNNTIKLLDMSGRVVKEIQSKLEAGANNIKMNLGELSTGIYTIQLLENNQLVQVSKVQKN